MYFFLRLFKVKIKFLIKLFKTFYLKLWGMQRNDCPQRYYSTIWKTSPKAQKLKPTKLQRNFKVFFQDYRAYHIVVINHN